MESYLFSFGYVQLEWQTVFLSFLLTFLISSLIAYVYERTFQGLSYSRGLVQSMILGSLVTCLLMIAIGDNIARGIGIVGSLAIIRFRTNLRDPRDLIFIFAALGVGVAAGVQSYMTAIIGGLSFCVASILLFQLPFGARRQHDGLVRFQASADDKVATQIAEIMKRIPQRFALVTMRDVAQGTYVDYSYQIKLANPDDGPRLIRAVSNVESVRGLSYMSQESTVEV